MMKTYLAFTARVLSVYAAILAFIHGVFELQQGKAIVEAANINAIGHGCIADQIWHACFPAITIWPTYFAAGLIIVVISTLFFLYILIFRNSGHSGWIMVVFAFTNLLSGGGFIPTFTAIMASAALFLNHKTKTITGRKQNTFGILWILSLSIYILYAAGGWLLGRYFNAFMVENSIFLLLGMNLCLPVLSIILAAYIDRK